MRKRVFCLGILVILMPIFFGCLDDVSKLGCSGDAKKQDIMTRVLHHPHVGKIGMPIAAIAAKFSMVSLFEVMDSLGWRKQKMAIFTDRARDMIRSGRREPIMTAISLFPFFMVGYYLDKVRINIRQSQETVCSMQKKE